MHLRLVTSRACAWGGRAIGRARPLEAAPKLTVDAHSPLPPRSPVLRGRGRCAHCLLWAAGLHLCRGGAVCGRQVLRDGRAQRRHARLAVLGERRARHQRHVSASTYTLPLGRARPAASASTLGTRSARALLSLRHSHIQLAVKSTTPAHARTLQLNLLRSCPDVGTVVSLTPGAAISGTGCQYTGDPVRFQCGCRSHAALACNDCVLWPRPGPCARSPRRGRRSGLKRLLVPATLSQPPARPRAR